MPFLSCRGDFREPLKSHSESGRCAACQWSTANRESQKRLAGEARLFLFTLYSVEGATSQGAQRPTLRFFEFPFSRDQPPRNRNYGFPATVSACNFNIRRNSRIAADVSCTLCQDGIASSESAPSRCALRYGTTPSLESTSGPLDL